VPNEKINEIEEKAKYRLTMLEQDHEKIVARYFIVKGKREELQEQESIILRQIQNRVAVINELRMIMGLDPAQLQLPKTNKENDVEKTDE
jgi:hypothetical protein